MNYLEKNIPFSLEEEYKTEIISIPERAIKVMT